MKNISFILFVLILYSCSSNKIIDSYLKNESSNERKLLYIVREKITPNITVKDINGSNRSNDIKSVFLGSKIITESQKSILLNKYEKDTLPKNWLSKDFKSNKVQFISNDPETLQKFLSDNRLTKSSVLYMFSKPIFTKDKKYVFFSFVKNTTNEWESKNCVIVMTKEEGKWKIIEEINSFYFN